MPLDQQCIALIKTTTAENSFRFGTGYLVQSNILLTARHVVYGETAESPEPKQISIKFLSGDDQVYQANAIWQDAQTDICLLKLVESKIYSNFAQWGRFDRTVSNESIKCESCGFPDAAKQGDKLSSQGLVGLLDRHAYVSSGLLGIALEHGFAPASAELCKGFSGAPIFVGDYLIGVVVLAPKGYEGEKIAAYPIEKLIDNPRFRELTKTSFDDLHLINSSKTTREENYQTQLDKMPLDEIPPISQLPKFSRMPLKSNPNFVGREDDFRAIARALKAGETTSIGQTVAATGMGGVGKTQLACEFAHRYGQYFAGGVFWLSFGDAQSIIGEIISCGSTHLHPNFNTLLVSDQLSLVKRSWDDPIPRLLIFDNCEDPNLLAEWRPSTGGCHILITSRRGKWNKSLAVKMVGLGILARESSIELLLRHRPDLATEREALNNIADELGDLPLALNLAGSFLEYFQHSPLGNPKEYLTTLQKSNIDHLSLTGGIDGYSPTKHDLNVARTFQYSYDQLKNDNEIDAIAKGLLKRAAFFACGEPIPRILLKACLKMEHTDNNEFKLERGIYRLIILGLLTESENGDVTLHRLIGLFVHKVDTNAQAQTDVEEIILKVNQELSTQEYTAPILFLLPHIKVVTDNAINREDSLSASLCDSLASHLKCIGYFKPALSYLQHTLTINEKALGPDHPDTAINLNNIGFLFRTLGKYQQAFPYYQRALTIREKILGPDHPDTALSLNNLGGLFFSIGKYQQAILYYQQALSICEKALGPDHPDTAICLNSLVSLFHSIGKYQQAINCAQRTLTINEKVLGLNHPNTALSLNNLGALFRIIGKYQQAINYYQQALDINQKVLGPDHPDTALNLNNLGFLFHSMEEYEKALPYYQRALTINEKFLGPDHPDTAINLNNLGGLFDSMKKYPQALSYYQHALHILKTKLSNNHPYIQTVQRNLEKLKAEMDLAKAQESPP